jgi:hypothetical protein
MVANAAGTVPGTDMEIPTIQGVKVVPKNLLTPLTYIILLEIGVIEHLKNLLTVASIMTVANMW